ncbi:MAG: UDP-N-acetylglucosamine 2-epimerase (non-hydrolyzing) [Nitrososphaeria archaeon]|jgi:UDP-N-acetylglucosamine 2-epimerase (non-hydrolysing)
MISIILGTRPEIVKFSSIIRECERLNLDYFILHTGQHYSYDMDKVFFEQLELPEPKYNLGTGSGTHAEQTGKMMIEIEKVLKRESPNIVLVLGDTNTALAGALVATKLGIKVGHIEAGLRSYDRTMPEEINRILVDHCSDYLFTPTEKASNILLNEGIPKDKIFMTGNTIVDAVYQNLGLAEKKAEVLNKLNLSKHSYFLATIHRQENVDNKSRFENILKGLDRVSERFDIPIFYAIHPRAKKQMEVFGLKSDKINFIEPLDYLNFLYMESKAKLVLTDSGGVQEETCILNVPCVTLRNNTERPETLEVESSILSGTNPKDIVNKVEFMLKKDIKWKNPFGDGNAGAKIIKILLLNKFIVIKKIAD